MNFGCNGEEGLKPNTRTDINVLLLLYRIFEDIVTSLSQLRQGDIVTFIVMVVGALYLNSSGAHLPD